MATEAAGVEREWHTWHQRQLADLEPGALGPCPLEPGGNLLARGRADSRVVEGRAFSLEHDAMTACQPDQNLARPVESARLMLIHLEREHLPELDPALALERHVPSGLELEPAQRGLVLEPATVDGGGQGEDGRLERLAHPAGLLEQGDEVTHRRILPHRPGSSRRGNGPEHLLG